MAPTLIEALAARPYPGRVCLAAVTQNGGSVTAYALTGRSEQSRARQLLATKNGDIRVADSRGHANDALRHYVASARRDRWLVTGNGDQVVPIAEALAQGRSQSKAWSHHTFEPDSPIWTPRIWLVERQDMADMVLGWARRAVDGNTHHGSLAVDRLNAGFGLLLTTYDGTA